MGKYIVHHEGLFLEWSSIVDAPITYGMTLEEFRAYWQEEYGRQGMLSLQPRLDRAIANGTSCMPPQSFRELASGNRAGPSEKSLSFKKLVQRFMIDKDDPADA